MTRREPRARVAVTLVEVLVCLVIFILALVPIVTLFTASHRTGFSARRLLDATLHAQVLLEAVAQLDSTELPAVPKGRELVLLDSNGTALAGGGRWPQVAAYFHRPPPIAEMTRVITAHRLESGELVIRVDVEWIAIVDDTRTKRRLSVQTFGLPRSWQSETPSAQRVDGWRATSFRYGSATNRGGREIRTEPTKRRL